MNSHSVPSTPEREPRRTTEVGEPPPDRLADAEPAVGGGGLEPALGDAGALVADRDLDPVGEALEQHPGTRVAADVLVDVVEAGAHQRDELGGDLGGEVDAARR